MTLARKYKLKTTAKIFQRFGKDLGIQVTPDKRISFKGTGYKRATSISTVGAVTREPLMSLEKV